LTVCHPAEVKIGSVGRSIPGVELRVAEDGELLACGPTVMRGYRRQPDKTAEAIDADGWLHTGDVVTVDDDGHVRIVDRKKELIINAAGKNMSPANIEQELKSACPLIGQAAVIGDARPYNVALLVLDPDAAGARARELGLGDGSVEAVARHEDGLAEVREGEAGVSRSTFYVYFEDKGDLLQVLTEDVMTEVIDAARGWWELPREADRADVEAAMRVIAAAYRGHVTLMAAVVEASSYDARVRE